MPQLRWISANMLVRSRDLDLAEEAGYITGQLLHLNGINLNLAPFVDLHAYEPGRRFSDNSREISLYARAYVQGLIKAHVGACAKHFPDGSPQNPHNRAGRVNLARRDLQVAERYQPLIDAGLPAIMVGHDIFTQVDPGIPASISRRWITDILREEMGFEGVIVTDSLGMTGLMHEVSSYEEAILRAFQAGADLLMANAPAVRNVLTRAVSTGEISRERISESARRILRFSEQFPIAPPATNKAELERALMRQAEDLYQRVIQ
jgi:beta-N-acetylhexosaminidase